MLTRSVITVGINRFVLSRPDPGHPGKWAGPTDRAIPANVRILVQGNNAFALDLHARLRSKEGSFLLPFQLPPELAQS
jgi:hypothetical protein